MFTRSGHGGGIGKITLMRGLGGAFFFSLVSCQAFFSWILPFQDDLRSGSVRLALAAAELKIAAGRILAFSRAGAALDDVCGTCPRCVDPAT